MMWGPLCTVTPLSSHCQSLCPSGCMHRCEYAARTLELPPAKAHKYGFRRTSCLELVHQGGCGALVWAMSRESLGESNGGGVGSGKQFLEFHGLLLIGRAQVSAATRLFQAWGVVGRDKRLLQDYGQGHSTVKRPGPRQAVCITQLQELQVRVSWGL